MCCDLDFFFFLFSMPQLSFVLFHYRINALLLEKHFWGYKIFCCDSVVSWAETRALIFTGSRWLSIAELFPAGGFKRLQLASYVSTEWVCTLCREFIFERFFFFLFFLLTLVSCSRKVWHFVCFEWAHFSYHLDTWRIFWHYSRLADCAVLLVCDYWPVFVSHACKTCKSSTICWE